MCSLRHLAKFQPLQAIMVQFCIATIESVLMSAVVNWFGAASSKGKGKLKHIIEAVVIT